MNSHQTAADETITRKNMKKKNHKIIKNILQYGMYY